MGVRKDGTGVQTDVDRAMAGWAQLSKNPEKMAEVMESFKDPDVVAKAQEMLKDPVYMASAKAKMAEITAKAQQNGLIDEAGNPVPGRAEAAMDQVFGSDDPMAKAMGDVMGKMGAAAGGGGQQAREWELENAAR